MTEAAGKSVSDAAAQSAMKASMETATQSASVESAKLTVKSSTANAAAGFGRRKRGSRNCNGYKGRHNQFAKHGTTHFG
jgi:hypothetical protein